MRVLRFLFFIGLAAMDAVVILVSNRGPETTTYVRSFFGEGWADLDRDCQDTRAEVLARESLVRVTKGCRVYRGEWLSYYDNKVTVTPARMARPVA